MTHKLGDKIWNKRTKEMFEVIEIDSDILFVVKSLCDNRTFEISTKAVEADNTERWTMEECIYVTEGEIAPNGGRQNEETR